VTEKPPPPLSLPLRPRRLAPGAALAVLVHVVVIAALVTRRPALPGAGPAGQAAPGLNFFVLPRSTPAAVSVSLTPQLQLADLTKLRRIAVDLPPLELPRTSFALPVAPVPTGTGGAEGVTASVGPGAASGVGAGAGAGPGTGDRAGYIFHAAPRTAILPPLARVPGSVAGRTLRVTFWVAADGRVTRVAVDPPITDGAYDREFQRRMMAYQFYPAHTRAGQNIADVVTVPLRIGN